jgi:hypothetical protein
MFGYWEYRTRRGAFRIVPAQNGWGVTFEDEGLGVYHSPASALSDLVGGHTFWPSAGDPSGMGLPDELAEWTFVPLAR